MVDNEKDLQHSGQENEHSSVALTDEQKEGTPEVGKEESKKPVAEKDSKQVTNEHNTPEKSPEGTAEPENAKAPESESASDEKGDGNDATQAEVEIEEEQGAKDIPAQDKSGGENITEEEGQKRSIATDQDPEASAEKEEKQFQSSTASEVDPGTTHKPESGDATRTNTAAGGQEVPEEEKTVEDGKTGDNKTEAKEEPEKDTTKKQPEHPQTSSQTDGDDFDDNDETDDDDDEDEHIDYSKLNKKDLHQAITDLLEKENYPKARNKVEDIHDSFSEKAAQEKEKALEKFVNEGGEEADFSYQPSDLDKKFEASYQLLKDRISSYYRNLNHQREENYQKKLDVLERLREFLDSEENNASFNKFKEFQEEWKAIGPVAAQHNKSLWANYHALVDRFYDNRSIYFELKELDRRKNLELKLELVNKARELLKQENLREAIKELNELHQEFKHIGPVPQEEQEELWQNFKAASDEIYRRRKEFYANLKNKLNDNLKAKQALVEEVKNFSAFDSTDAREWNKKTRAILELQKKWENIGGLPRAQAKDVNKEFWSNFKAFFGNKNKFFKKLDAEREGNLEAKQELLKEAESLRDSTDWNNTANKLKELQRRWKEAGPVPSKYRNELYKKFKAACDQFFEAKRAASGQIRENYKENLKKKEAIVRKINELSGKEAEIDKLQELQDEFNELGFVPKGKINEIKDKYNKAVSNFLNQTDIDQEEKNKLKIESEVQEMITGPNADRKIYQKEQSLRKRISKVEDEIALLRNNMEFFSDSSKAQTFKEQFTRKIEQAGEELEDLKDQLRILREMS